VCSWLSAHLILWDVAVGLAFLLVGAFRALRVWTWRLEQLEVALSGRLGLPPSTRAPAFSLPSVPGARVTLKRFAGRRVLLVFTQSSQGPWQQLLPELNRLQRRGNRQMLLIETGGLAAGHRKLVPEADLPCNQRKPVTGAKGFCRTLRQATAAHK
jgi:hypothetical protein